MNLTRLLTPLFIRGISPGVSAYPAIWRVNGGISLTFNQRSILKKLKLFIIAVILVLLAVPEMTLQAQDPEHPDLRKFDTITMAQQKGPTLRVIGYGRFQLSYSETVDGYTIVRNEQGVYEYAERAGNGDLEPSGTVAHDPSDRSEDERSLLEDTPKHLRYRDEALKEKLETQNRFFRLEDQ